VHSRDNNEYRQIPYKHLDQQAPNTYSLRKGGVGRFEKRDAKEMLKYVVELMRDESAAFKAWDDRILSKEIRLLDQNLNRLEQNILQKSSYIDSLEYLLINSNKSEDIWVEFWSTVGELGNNIIPGSKLKTSSINFKKDSIMIMNHSSGGKAKLKSSEIVYAFKSALLSRDRLVTLEDIKAACFSELGTDIKDVKVQKGIMTGLEMGQGLLRTIDITLSLAKDSNKSPEELKQLANQLKVVLENKMSAHNTLRIEFVT
jgi:hypothetical protein